VIVEALGDLAYEQGGPPPPSDLEGREENFPCFQVVVPFGSWRSQRPDYKARKRALGPTGEPRTRMLDNGTWVPPPEGVGAPQVGATSYCRAVVARPGRKSWRQGY